MVLGKLPVLGRLTIWLTGGQRPIVIAVGGGVFFFFFDVFALVYAFSPLSPSPVKYCLKGPINPKTTNQPYFNTLQER